MDLIGDYIYFAPSHEVADIHSKVAPVYMYEFAHRRTKANENKEWMGVVHADNVPYDFGLPFFPVISLGFDDGDRKVSLFIMRMYSNFAKNGDPTSHPGSGVTSERYNSSRRAYLRVDVHPKMSVVFAPRRMAFWNDYYSKLAHVNFDTKDEFKVSSGASFDITMGIFLKVVLGVIFGLCHWGNFRCAFCKEKPKSDQNI